MRRTATIRETTAPLTNPKPDRRKNDWTGAKEFPAARYVVDDTSIRRIGHGRHNYVLRTRWKSDGTEAYDLIVSNSKLVEPQGIRELLATMGDEENATMILGLLLKKKVVTTKQIDDASLTLDEADESLWDLL